MVFGVLASDGVVNVTAPGATADVLCKVIGFKGKDVNSLPTDLVSAESLASDMTYKVFGGLVVTGRKQKSTTIKEIVKTYTIRLLLL